MEEIVLITPKSFKKSDYSSFAIVADVGGTNTTLAIMGAKSSTSFEIIFKHTYQTKEITLFETILNTALREAKELYDIETNAACLAAAGYLEKNRTYAKLTNCDRTIDTTQIIKKTLLAKILLLNDFEAIGYGLDTLNLEKDTLQLNPDAPKNPDSRNTFAAIGPGTGLGMSIAPFDPRKGLHIPLPTEGGHMDFPASSELEVELMWFIRKKQPSPKNHTPGFEDVLSGRGMENIYDFLSTKYPLTPVTKIINKFSGAEKLDKIRENHSRDGQCKKTVEMFITFYARAAKNLALLSCCYSGLFLAGRIALKYQDHLKTPLFLNEVRKQGSNFLKTLPIYLITTPDIALHGCCNFALNKQNPESSML